MDIRLSEVARARSATGAIARAARYLVIIAVAAVAGCVPGPTPTTPQAVSPSVVGSPNPTAAPTGPHGEKLIEQSAETRFQLDLHVPDAALAQFIPSVWRSNVATSGAADVGPGSEIGFYSARNPNLYQLSRQDEVLDILRNVTTTPQDRVHGFLFTCVGGSYASICDGSQKVLSLENIPWLNRQIFQP